MKIAPATSLSGHVGVPGDKSISHRAVLIGALCEGETQVLGFGRSEDTWSTVRAVRALGIDIEEISGDELLVHGNGLRGLSPPAQPVDCGNAGTLMRLLAGIAAGQSGRFELTGDESLTRRPMERIAEPLRRMGARIETTDGHAPLAIEGSDALQGTTYTLPMASAQVKSAILLAGLNAAEPTTVVEARPTRDHTELMLEAAGASVRRRASSVTVEPAGALRLEEVRIPGDFSSAAPLIVAASIVPGSELTIHDVGVNARRAGLLTVLDRMGARVTVFNRRRSAGEQIADIEVHSAELTATAIEPDEVPSLVDELPLFALAAAHAHGESIVRGAEELRVKESDRIESVVAALRALGVRAKEREDGFEIRGVPARPRGGRVDSAGDHRIAMLGAVAGLASREGVEIEGAEAVAVSWPGFFELLDSVAQRR